MAKNVIINGVTYSDVPRVEIPLINSEDTAKFYDTSDATLNSGNKMLSGNTAYANGTKYTGTIETKDSTDLTANGAMVTVPSGYYAENANKTIVSGSATTPNTTINVTPNIAVDSSTGLISVSVSDSRNVTPDVSAGYISSGTAGTIAVSGSDTEQLTTKSSQTITPSTSDTIISAGQFLIGAQTIKGDVNLISSNIKSGVSIFGVSGSLTSATVSQDSTTKVLSIS